MKQSGSNYSQQGCHWWTRSNTGVDTGEELTVLQPNLDSDGYVTTLAGLTATYVETWMNVNIIADTPLPGAPLSGNALFPAQVAVTTYRLQFQGAGTINIPSATMLTATAGCTISGSQVVSTNAWGTTNSITFSTNTNIHVQVTAIPTPITAYPKAMSIVDNTLAASYDAGEVFHPYWKAFMTGNGALRGLSRLRGMGGLHTNAQDINLSFSADLAPGATSGTLTKANNGTQNKAFWPFPTGTYQVVFGNAGADVRAVSFTYNSTACSWTGGLGTLCAAASVTGARGAQACAALYTWSTRPLPSNVSWGGYAIPYEVFIQAAIELNIDTWLNIPCTAQIVDSTSVFLNSLAKLCFNGTGANINGWNVSSFPGMPINQTAYLENSNEVAGAWNGGAGYAQGANALLIPAVATGLYAANGNNVGQSTAEYYGVQLANICDQFKVVYTTLSPRVNVTCMCQFATGNGINFLTHSMNTPNSTSAAYTHGIGAWGFAPYMPLANMIAGWVAADQTAFFALSAASQIDEVYSLAYSATGKSGHVYGSGSWAQSAITTAAAMQAAITAQPWATLPVHCYESGINAAQVVGIPAGNLSAFLACMTGVLRDNRIQYIYYDPTSVFSSNVGYYSALKNLGITVNHLGGVAPTPVVLSSAGWGLIEEIMQMVGIEQNLGTVPRYAAAINYACAAIPATQTFDFYISTSGSDSAAGTVAAPWTINSLSPYSTGAALTNYQTKIAGKRIGLLPGTYGVGALCNASFTANAKSGIALDLPGGTSTASTYVGSSNASGFYSPRTATISASDLGPFGGSNTTKCGIIGQSYLFGAHGYVTIDGIRITGGAIWGVNFGNVAGNNYSGNGFVLQNCEITGFSGANQTTNQGDNLCPMQILSATGAVIKNNWVHDNVGINASFGDVQHFSALYHWGLNTTTGGTSGTQILNNTIVNSGHLEGKETVQFNSTIAYNYIDMTLYTPAGTTAGSVACILGFNGDSGHGTTGTVIHHNILKSFAGSASYSPSSQGGTWLNLWYGNDQNAWDYPCQVYNNTLIASSNLNGAGIMWFETTAGAKNLTYYNNLIYDGGFNAVSQFGWWWTQEDAFALCDYNIYGTTFGTKFGSFQPNGQYPPTSFNPSATATTLAAWQTDIGGLEAHSSTNATNPFTNNGSYALQYQVQSGSPAFQTGKVGGVSSGATTNVGAWDGTVTQIGCNFAT